MEQILGEDMSMYTSLEEYFTAHPDDEQGFYDDMAEQAYHDNIVEYPEDWTYA